MRIQNYKFAKFLRVQFFFLFNGERNISLNCRPNGGGSGGNKVGVMAVVSLVVAVVVVAVVVVALVMVVANHWLVMSFLEVEKDRVLT